MSVVVLLGYSTSGKSTIGKAVRTACKKAGLSLTIRDSDDEIGTANGGHIADIYLSREYTDAVTYIEQAERGFLESLQGDGTAMLVVTGPNLPLREPQWSEFLGRVRAICYYLEIGPSICYRRLAGRQEKLAKQYGSNPRFGSWNKGSLCDYDTRMNRYVNVSPEEANLRLIDLMRENIVLYKRDVTGDRLYRSQDLERNSNLKQLVTRICQDLAV